MRLSELKDALVRAGIRDDAYELTGGLPPERFCIQEVTNGWEVYYSERGVKSHLKVFPSEREAADYFLRFVLSDPSAYTVRPAGR